MSSKWEKKSVMIHIRLPGRVREALEAESKRLERPMSFIVLQLLGRRYPDPDKKP